MNKLAKFLMAYFFLLSPLFSSEERGSSAPLISGDTFRAFSDHIYDETTTRFDPSKVKPGQIVFVKTDHDHLAKFFYRYHPAIKGPYILITHNSDHQIPGPFSHYLDDEKIIAWFGQNAENYTHPKLIPIPIGLANRCWDHGNPTIFMNKIVEFNKPLRDIHLYLNFAISTFPNERKRVYNLFSKTDYCVLSNPKQLNLYLDDLKHSKFVLSPRGNGLDCHRTWEALLMGAYPIVRTSTLDVLYDDLPVIIVNEWEEIDQEFLDKKYAEMSLRKYNLGKIYIYYWLDLIKKYQEDYAY